MYFKKKDNAPDSEQYLKQDGIWATYVMIIDDYFCEVSSNKTDRRFTLEYQNEAFEPCTEKEFETGLKKAMSILKKQLL